MFSIASQKMQVLCRLNGIQFFVKSRKSYESDLRYLGLSVNSTGRNCMYTVSQKNVPPMACYNFDTYEQILIFFGRNVIDKVGNQKMLQYNATSNNLCFRTTWQTVETRK